MAEWLGSSLQNYDTGIRIPPRPLKTIVMPYYTHEDRIAAIMTFFKGKKRSPEEVQESKIRAIEEFKKDEEVFWSKITHDEKYKLAAVRAVSRVSNRL